MSEQMTFKRYEIKYRISREQMRTIVEGMKEYMIPDEHGRSTIQSLYFDTPDHRLVRKSMEKPVYKEKLRLRSYGVAGKDTTVFLELKKKYESIVYKRRIGMSLAEMERYLQTGEISGEQKTRDAQVTGEIDYFLSYYEGIQPSVMLSYEREAYYAKEDHEFRVTFDDNILFRTEDLGLDAGIYGRRLLDPDSVMMEVKAGEGIPLWFAKLLSEAKAYQSSFSKYGTAYAVLEAERRERTQQHKTEAEVPQGPERMIYDQHFIYGTI